MTNAITPLQHAFAQALIQRCEDLSEDGYMALHFGLDEEGAREIEDEIEVLEHRYRLIINKPLHRWAPLEHNVFDHEPKFIGN